VGAFLQELVSVGVYKRSQGRITRQVTFGAVAAGVLLGLFRLHQFLGQHGPQWSFGVPIVLGVLGVWAAYRLVNLPVFADFLIAVEAEMNKVSWPTRHELLRGSVVVLVVILFLAAVLWVFDIVWSYVFHGLNVI
jgi:preprotein translocase subunit SecE